MARRKVFHSDKISYLDKRFVSLNIVDEGDMVEFKYKADNIFDNKPIVFIFEKQNTFIKGINLNYLTDLQIRKIFQELQERGGNTLSESLPITTEDQEEEEEYDGDRKPNKKLLKKPYTRIKLPTYQEEDDSGATISKSVAETQMRRLYEKVIKRYVDRFQVYRSYSYKLIQVPQVIYYDTEGMQK